MTSDVQHQIEATGPACVMDALAALGRTEDLRFSPDGRRLAITCFEAGAIAVVDVEVSAGEASVRIEHTAITRLVVAGLEAPHGVDWLDDRTLIVADRAGWMGLLDVPPSRPNEAVDRSADLLPFDGDFADLYGPGSVAVVRREEGQAEVLICNNWGNRVTRNRLHRNGQWAVSDSSVCLQRLLDLPDGVATSRDGSWLAVSNHNRQVIVVYENGAAPAEVPEDIDRSPIGVLRGTSYPHGLRFTQDGGQLLVADAGSPFVHAYRRGGSGWSVTGYPASALQVVSWKEFEAGNSGPGEGGPKGIDLDPTERVLVVTCGEAPLRWFDLRAALAAAPPPPANLVPLEIEGLERETALKASLAQFELRLMETETREHEAQALASRMVDRAVEAERAAAEQCESAMVEIEAAKAGIEAAKVEIQVAERSAEDAHQHLAAIQATKLWRVASPFRRLYGRVRNGRSTNV